MASNVAPINTKSKLHIEAPGKTIEFSQYVANQVKKFPSLDPKIVTGISMHAKAGVDFDGLDSIEDKKAKKQAKEFIPIAIADFKAHKKNKEKFEADEVTRKADEAAAKEAAAKAEYARKEADAKLLDSNLESKSLAVIPQLTEKISNEMVKTYGSKIGLDSKTGLIVVAEGAKKEDFALAFATLVKQNEAGTLLADRSAKHEAQIACAARTTMGDEWEDLFGGRKQDISRIKQGINTFDTVKKIGKQGIRLFKLLPLNTLRSLTEMKVTTAAELGDKDKADAVNLKAKTEVIEAACKFIDERKATTGKATLVQSEARNIVAEYKKSLGIKAKEKLKNFYIAKFNDQTYFWGDAEKEPNEHAVKNAVFAFDSNGYMFSWAGKGKIEKSPIGDADETVLKKLREWAKEAEDEKDDKPEPAKGNGKGKGKGKAPAEPAKASGKEDELEDEDEDETPAAVADSDDDGDEVGDNDSDDSDSSDGSDDSSDTTDPDDDDDTSESSDDDDIDD